MKSIVKIKPRAFEEIIRACYETLSRESIGYLFGRIRTNGRTKTYIIETIHPVQLATRYPNGCEIDYNIDKRASWSLNGDKPIGDYHSHPTSRKQKNGIRKLDHGRVLLSKCDVADLKETPTRISIVIGIRRVKKTYKARISRYLIIGYLKEKNKAYKIQIGAYYFNSGKRKSKIEISKELVRKFL